MLADMLLTTHFLTMVMLFVWKLPVPVCLLFYILFAPVEATYWSATLGKVPTGAPRPAFLRTRRRSGRAHRVRQRRARALHWHTQGCMLGVVGWSRAAERVIRGNQGRACESACSPAPQAAGSR